VAHRPDSIVRLLVDGALDTQLAAELWLLIEAGVPVVIASDRDRTGASGVLDVCLSFVRPDIRLVELAGRDERFTWLPQASELGSSGSPRATEGEDPVRPGTTVLVAREIADRTPKGTWGESARIAVRAASIGYGLAATVPAASLEDVFALLQGPGIGLSADECSHLGLGLILDGRPGPRRRIAAAHYIRPTARDVHGHVQRLGPAVLATWDQASDTFEHFGWGVIPELARRIGIHAGDFEIEQTRRSEYLAGSIAAGLTRPADVRQALRAYRPAVPIDAPMRRA
jgi:hypothetical protein